MAKIRVLDEQLANQIAAGEVVERPAAVVKELVENAVDAGSSTIDILIEEGGLQLIRITDDGSGIAAEELETAFQRHATSKLHTSGDLFRIASLGFRGEALPSIAAVSRVQLTSSTETSGLAHRIVIEGGEVKQHAPANAPMGTDIIVRELFYNTPARLKYMKSIQTELGHISDYVYRLALAHPGIAFSLKHNGNSLLRTLGNGDRQQVIAAVYGTNTARAMLAVEGEHPDYDLRGYISKPEQTRANRNGITVIVNGRYIRSFVLNQALLQAYHTLLPINRFPMAVLEIGMHPSLVDVNVHPSKMEVRFSKEAELREFVQQAVQQVLARQVHIPGPASAAPRAKPAFVQDQISFHRPEPQDQPRISVRTEASAPSNAASSQGSFMNQSWNQETPYIPNNASERLYKPSEATGSAGEGQLREGSLWQQSTAPASGLQEQAAAIEQPQQAPSGLEENTAGESFPELSWIGQLHGTYLIGQNDSGMYMIDQHAAHERIHYEYYYERFGNPGESMQQLLVPITLELTAAEAEQLRGKLPILQQAGVELESFGQHAFLVRSHPHWLPQGEEQQIIEEMVEWVLQEKRAIDIAKLREKSAIMCSCKASIKANQRLTREEGEALFSRLAACKQPYTCPHGRPIIVHLSTYQLEKMFKRVMS